MSSTSVDVSVWDVDVSVTSVDVRVTAPGDRLASGIRPFASRTGSSTSPWGRQLSRDVVVDRHKRASTSLASVVGRQNVSLCALAATVRAGTASACGTTDVLSLVDVMSAIRNDTSRDVDDASPDVTDTVTNVLHPLTPDGVTS